MPSQAELREIMKRLLLSRMRILNSHSFYGLLLAHMKYSIDIEAETAYTDGYTIAFDPSFLDKISDSELDFVMMHEIMHVVLHHCFRSKNRNGELFNIAADIVVNSNIMLENKGDINSITLSGYSVSMHKAPNGNEGHLYTAEQVYEMFPEPLKKASRDGALGDGDGEGGSGNGKTGRGKKKPLGSIDPNRWDNHDQWGKYSDNRQLRDEWVKNFVDACETIQIRDPSNSRGTLPEFARRLLKELTEPQLDWRAILNEFVQEDLNDYSFSPPDRRFQDSPFFLPDYNDYSEGDNVKNILFMIDTSASMSDDMITRAYSEIKGAVDQWDGRLCGWLGFFDAGIIEPQPFSDIDELTKIYPAGGGGTDFDIIFAYVDKHMSEDPPVSIIILTDGFAPFPPKNAAHNIPVLWLLNNNEVDPPWGKTARITL